MAQDQKLIGMLTGAAQHCGPRPGQTSPTLVWSVIAVNQGEGGWQYVAAAKLLTKKHKNVIFDIMSEVHKDSEDFLQEYINFKNSNI